MNVHQQGPAVDGDFSFRPDAKRARVLDRKMRSRLADSLDHVFERSREALRVDADEAGRLVAELRGERRFGPLVFALYYDLVDAILAGRLDDAQALIDDIVEQRPLAKDFAIVTLSDADLGPGNSDRYARMMDTDPESPFIFATPDAALAGAFRPHLETALEAMESAAPELHAEFRALVSQIVLTDGHSGLKEKSGFHGGSSFLLWGALFINPGNPASPIALVETLAHEAAHTLLFGLSIDEKLVDNPDSERFSSPFRMDPRPMDGIYHATFVAARMHYATEAFLRHPIGRAQSAAVQAALEQGRSSFRDGLGTVEAHGRLSPTGRAVLAEARRYMEGAAG